AFDNSAFFYEQLEFTWLISVRRVAGREIDAPGSDPILLYHALVRYFLRAPIFWFVRPAFPRLWFRHPAFPNVRIRQPAFPIFWFRHFLSLFLPRKLNARQ